MDTFSANVYTHHTCGSSSSFPSSADAGILVSWLTGPCSDISKETFFLTFVDPWLASIAAGSASPSSLSVVGPNTIRKVWVEGGPAASVSSTVAKKWTGYQYFSC